MLPLGMDWIEVTGGLFAMGDGPRDNENPCHEVQVSPFRLARTPVTREAYQSFLDATGQGLGENVHEWCADWYDPRYYEVSPRADPPGPATGVRRSSRCGAWRHQVKGSRCAARSAIPPGMRYNDYGFRLAAGGRRS